MPSQNDVIASGNHATLAFSKMKSLREKSALCDISLKINSTEMRAHKVILAASSPYFEFMFTGNVTERTKECIEISGFCPDAFLTVLNFMYSGYLVVNEQTMLNVLKVADFLKISSAKEKCIQYLQDHIKISNCFEIRDIAKKYYFTELEAKIKRFIENNFVELIKSEEFFQLSADELSGLITEDRTYTDDSLYKEAISNWVDYEKSSREDMTDDLLGLLSAHIQNMAQKELIMHNSLLEKRIYVVSRGSSGKKIQFFDLKNKRWHIVCDKPELNCIEPIFHNQFIFLIGNDRFARFNMESEEWEIKKIPFSNDFTAACSVHNGIYLIIKGPSKGSFIYNTETNVLYTDNQLIYKRCNPGVAFSERLTAMMANSVLPKYAAGSQPFTVFVEGNIGSGKTTFLKHFDKYDEVCLITEPVEQWRNCGGVNLLELMYKEPYRWAMPFQMYVTMTMLQRHTQTSDKSVKLMERSLLSSRYCFVENMYKNGTLHKGMYHILQDWYAFIDETIHIQADAIVYLRTNPEVVYDRMVKRARSEESCVPLEYLKELHQLHEDWLIHRKIGNRNIPVVVLDANLDLDNIISEYRRSENTILRRNPIQTVIQSSPKRQKVTG